jgi:diaminohydroxyphosphoribosylaminopyrimidine deaminase/5-amino-6-(5-phosphoribosylamino)uracil reductase
MQNKEFFMKRALKLAQEYKGYTHPNPAVGAVLVKNGRIIGEGAHKKAGDLHAERIAIQNAKEDIEGSTLFVTLEPCCHYGKTPPCTDAIIDSRIKKVVVATLDPNPLVAGKGVEILKNQGIEVEVGVMEEEAKELNEDFFVYIREGRPFIHLKFAQTIDGKIATRIGDSKWITGEEARRYAHILRKEAGAVMVGSGTALNDNPSLTVRHINVSKQPKRVLIDKYLDTPVEFNIFNKEAETILITSEKANKGKLQELEKRENIKIFILPLENERFNLKEVLSLLKEEGIIHILVEGGRGLITSFIKENLFDKFSVFIAPKIIGEDGISSVGELGIETVGQAINLKPKHIKQLGDDVLLQLSSEKALLKER